MTEPRTVAFRTADGIDLAADRYGAPSRGSVLLAHGGGQTRYAWAKTAAALGELGWEAVAIDLRGHGDSGWSPNGDYQIERFAEDLASVAREIGNRPALIGASAWPACMRRPKSRRAHSARSPWSTSSPAWTPTAPPRLWNS